jgi:hypothetical protein
MRTAFKLLLVAVVLLVIAIGAALYILPPGIAPPSPTVRPFGDNKFWIVVEPINYSVGQTSDVIVVPKGFVTDFASIPQALWSLGLSPHGKYSRAAVIHDYLYWSQSCTRKQADRLLLIAMKESNVGGFDEFAVYRGVDLGGSGSWNNNAAERGKGLPRIIPEEYLRPENPNDTWPMYREYLVKHGVVDPPFADAPRYCAYGDSTEVPK